MEETLPLLKFIKSKYKPSEFLDVEPYLSNRGFDDYKPMKEFIDELLDLGYIRLDDSGFSKYVHDQDIGVKTGNKDFAFKVQLTAKGEQFLIDNERITISLKATKVASRAAWLSGIVALLTFAFSVYQSYTKTERETLMSKRDSTLTELRLKVSILSIKVESLSSSQIKSTSHSQKSSIYQHELKNP